MDVSSMDCPAEEIGLLNTEMAPNLARGQMYHVMLLYHRGDHEWVFLLAQKLQSPSIGLQCFCQDGDFDPSGSVVENIIQAFSHSRKTVLVLSHIFLRETWPTCRIKLAAILEGKTVTRKRIVVVAIDDCEIPSCLAGLPYLVRTDSADWYPALLRGLDVDEQDPGSIEDNIERIEEASPTRCTHLDLHIAPYRASPTKHTHSSLTGSPARASSSTAPCSVSVIGVQSSLYNGYLLCSVKSKCGWCGKEYVDIKEVPPDLATHGIQVPDEEYRSALEHLFSDGHFTCYLWCYNLPFTVIFFAALLGLCLAAVPVLDAYAGLLGHQTGVEYVLGVVVWMCCLTLYLIVMYLSRKKMKAKTHQRLSRVNAVLMKRHLLVGFEQLGSADCNKYFLHFFYYDLGPCLAYLQELLMNTECTRTTIYMNQSADPTLAAETDIDMQAASGDTVHMQPSTSLTNTAIQSETEKALLNQSGEYINLLIRKKLERPEVDRHMNRYPCLCQFVEHQIYRMMTDV